MSQTDEFGRRIAAAMERIGRAIDAVGGGADAAEMEELRQALEDERLANAQLEERLKTIRERQDARLHALEAAKDEQRETVARLDDQLQRLRKANDQLRENNVALRSANAEGVAEPHLINKSMLAELESLRAGRAADVAEANVILGALAPLIDGERPGAEEY